VQPLTSTLKLLKVGEISPGGRFGDGQGREQLPDSELKIPSEGSHPIARSPLLRPAQLHARESKAENQQGENQSVLEYLIAKRRYCGRGSQIEIISRRGEHARIAAMRNASISSGHSAQPLAGRTTGQAAGASLRARKSRIPGRPGSKRLRSNGCQAWPDYGRKIADQRMPDQV